MSESKQAFRVEHKGFIADGFWGEGADGRVVVTKDGQKIFEFTYPAYKIFNIAAHWTDIIDGELAGTGEGWLKAGWAGFDAFVLPKEIEH
jgi:hypothetical protein